MIEFQFDLGFEVRTTSSLQNFVSLSEIMDKIWWKNGQLDLERMKVSSDLGIMQDHRSTVPSNRKVKIIPLNFV